MLRRWVGRIRARRWMCRLRLALGVWMRRRGGIGRGFSFRGWRICWFVRRATTTFLMSVLLFTYVLGRIGGGNEVGAYESLSVVDFLASGDLDCLYEELVAAFGVWWWIFLHSLEEYCSIRQHHLSRASPTKATYQTPRPRRLLQCAQSLASRSIYVIRISLLSLHVCATARDNGVYGVGYVLLRRRGFDLRNNHYVSMFQVPHCILQIRNAYAP